MNKKNCLVLREKLKEKHWRCQDVWYVYQKGPKRSGMLSLEMMTSPQGYKAQNPVQNSFSPFSAHYAQGFVFAKHLQIFNLSRLFLSIIINLKKILLNLTVNMTKKERQISIQCGTLFMWL